MHYAIYKSALVLVLVISGTFMALSPKSAHACLWGDATCVELSDSMTKIREATFGILLGALKNAVVQVITQNVYMVIGGARGGGAMFITDWRVALYVQPNQRAQLALNDFFTLSTGGRNSLSNYRSQNSGSNDWSKVPEGALTLSDSSETTDTATKKSRVAGVTDDATSQDSTFDKNDIADIKSGNYSKYLTEAAKVAVMPKPCKVDIQEYGTVGATFKSLDALTSDIGGYCNSVFNYTAAANEIFNETLSAEINIAQTQGIAYDGYIGLTQGGIVITPGSNLKSLIDNASDVSNKVMAAIENPYEFAAASISTAVNVAVNVLTQQGIAYVNNMTQQGVGYINSKIHEGTSSVSRNTGGYVNIGTSGYNYNVAAPYVSNNYTPQSQQLPGSTLVQSPRNSQW